jgi:hypothetical protein
LFEKAKPRNEGGCGGGEAYPNKEKSFLGKKKPAASQGRFAQHRPLSLTFIFSP